MRRRALIWWCAFAVMVMAFLLSGDLAVRAGTPGVDVTTTTVASPVTIVADVEIPNRRVPGSDGDDDARPRVVSCSWIDVGTDAADVGVKNERSVWIADVLAPVNGVHDVVAVRYYERFGVLHRWGSPSMGGGVGWIKAQRASCPVGNTDGYRNGEWRWVTSVPPDPVVLLPGARRRVTEIVEAPTPRMNPASPG